MKIKRYINKFLIITLLFLLCSCVSNGEFKNPGDSLGGGGTVTEEPSEPNVDDVITDIETAIDINDSTIDTLDTWDETATEIYLADSATEIIGSGAQYINNVVAITETGTYVLSGTLTNGIVYVEVDGNVQLVLNGVNITSNNSAPIAIFGKKKKVVTLATDTENYLTDASEYTVFYNTDNDEPNGTLFAKKALTINGTGKLIVQGNYNNGISCKDELKILSGNIDVTAKNNAIKGSDSVIIKGGQLNITSDGDGIKSDNEEEGLGTIYLETATITINSESDGIQAYRYLQVTSGTISIKTAGGATSTSSSQTRPGDWGSASDDGESTKGLKSDISILISGGTINLNTYDDAIHCDGTVIINGGQIQIASGDDGIHADEVLTINDGIIEITKCYEGIEAAKITINGGETSVISSDDGINAADGTSNAMGVTNSNCAMIINGGKIYVNATGDGVDSNGTIVMSGGELYIDGPTGSGNGSLDSDGGFLMKGGILIAVGSLGMVETPAQNSTQYCVSYACSTSITANTTISLKDSTGITLVGFTPVKSYRSVIISCPKLVKGGSYSINSNDTQLTSFTISSIITTVGSSNSGGNGGGGHGGRPW